MCNRDVKPISMQEIKNAVNMLKNENVVEVHEMKMIKNKGVLM